MKSVPDMWGLTLKKKETGLVEHRFGFRSKQLLVSKRIVLLTLVLLAMFSAMPLGTQRVAAEDYGTVYVHAYACGSFNGIPPTSQETLANSCVLTPYYNSFFITSEGKTTKGLPSNNFMDWTWQGVANHQFQILGQVDGQHSNPVVYCTNGAQDHYELMQSTTDYNGSYVHPTMAGGYVTCDWFAMDDGPENTGQVSIDAFMCPKDFDSANAGMNDFYQACDQRENGSAFAISSDTNILAQLVTGANADGNVFWPYVNPGPIYVQTNPVAGYETARVFCRSEVTSPQSVEFDGAGGLISYDLSAGEKLDCDWYDISEAGAKVTIFNHLCPDGPDLRTVDIYTLTATCNLPFNGVSFELKSSQENRQDETGGTAASGIVWFDVVPTETTITEIPVAGYLSPRVLCTSTSPNGKQSKTIEAVVDQNSITEIISDGDYLQCDWFNLPDHGVGQVGSIAVYPVACPADFDVVNSTIETATEACQTPQDLTKFDLASKSDALTQTSGWYESGVAKFYGIPDQELALTAHPLDGMTSGAVFCGQDLESNGQINGYEHVALVNDNTIVPHIVPGSQEICHWFMTPAGSNQNNVNSGDATPTASDPDATPTSGDASGDQNDPSGDNGSLDINDQSMWTGRVEITVRVCPSGFDTSSGDLNGSCVEDGNGIGFSIFSANQWWPQGSGQFADQMVVWEPVPQQDVTIKEDVPGGFSTPIAFCGDGQQMNVNGDGSINVTIGDHETLNCTFYNVQN